MPQYEWRCRNCGQEEEVTRSMQDRTTPPGECSSCAAEDWERILSPSLFSVTGDNASNGYGTRTRKK